MNCHKYLIRGARVYDHDGDVHQPPVADVLIEGDRVVAVGPNLPVEGAEVLAGAGKLIIPGFVNAHYHSHDVMAKGLFEGMPLDFWSVHSNPGQYGSRALEEVRVRTLIGAAEALRNGVTAIQDMVTLVPRSEAMVDTVLGAYRDIGIRVAFGIAARDKAALDIAPFVAADIPQALRDRITGKDRPAKDELAFIESEINRLGLAPGPSIHWALAPSGPQRCSDELLEGIADLSRRYGLSVFTHVYETKVQAASARLPGERGSALHLLQRAGLLNDRLSIAHGVWLSPDEISLLAEAGSCLVHNPVSNLKLKSGAAPILALERAGVRIALGCDTCSCGDTQNIFHAMRMLCLLPAIADPEPGPITAEYAFRAATLAGAGALGLKDRIGAIKPGMQADLVILDLGELAFIPFNSAVRQIVFAEAGRAVETVFVGGRRVVHERKLTTIDEGELARQAAEYAPEFRARALKLVEENAALRAPLMAANRAAFATDVGFDRYLK